MYKGKKQFCNKIGDASLLLGSMVTCTHCQWEAYGVWISLLYVIHKKQRKIVIYDFILSYVL